MLATPRAEAIWREPDHTKSRTPSDQTGGIGQLLPMKPLADGHFLADAGPALWDRGEWCT